MEEPLTKVLLTGHYTARIEVDGTLTIAKLEMDELTREAEIAKIMHLPPQATRTLLNMLVTDAARARIGHRRWQGSKPGHK